MGAMDMRRTGLGIIGALTLWTVPAAAQSDPVPALPVAVPLPSNAVNCVYDYMSAEDREMSLLLIAREIVDGGRFSKASKNVQAVDRLIEEAHQKCLARFNWSVARSDNATGFALTSILAEALGQALESFGHPPAPITDFFREDHGTLAGKRDFGKADQSRLKAYLADKGWGEVKEAEFGLARLYLETLMLRDEAERRFAVAGGTGSQPIRRPPPQTRKARRGKP
jgi:hypothetical protein